MRKIFGLLPHPRTRQSWYSKLGKRPGFTEEALNAIRLKAKEKAVLVNVVVDEMSIRAQKIFDGNKIICFVDLGANHKINRDNATLATHALVFMTVAVNDSWKLTIGYFLIHSLAGKERNTLLEKSICVLEEAGGTPTSITFDGASVNETMVTTFGANFNFGYPNFQP